MAITKWQKEDNLFPSFSSFFDDFFGKDFARTGISVPAVNVKENKNQFSIEMAAPGMKKEDFKVKVDHNMLTISSEKRQEHEEKGEDDEKYTRREYSFHSFTRSFSLPENADGENVKAAYKDGVLNITIPKKKDSQMRSKEIEIG